MYENRSDNLSNNLRLNEISILIFFQFHCKINRNRLEIVLEATYGLQPYKYYEILNLKFWGRSKVIKRSRFHSNSQGVHEIKDFPVSVDFQAYKHAVVTPVQYYISMPSIRNAILHIFTTFLFINELICVPKHETLQLDISLPILASMNAWPFKSPHLCNDQFLLIFVHIMRSFPSSLDIV